ncbi:TPA: undecaprenyldiphospho-muramoylpentapeptide beta-N-acetylglucosaminyltransferase [Candidatus Taylorbacteria bacterium]|nr:undecaprenyldiphospho-muramoylpentapeptide beta-N-acetylglucosaminyltransferase [Candidatus Taylorbacteria bacterium]
MKILFTGGGTGGHFYPIIGVAQALDKVVRDQHLLPPDMYYMAPTPYDMRALFENNIVYRPISAGKVRRYFSILNFFDLFKTAWGIIKATIAVYKLYPDVVFGKGGYASFPVLFAAKILRIPVIIHESDSKPGRVNAWAAKFARRIAISYPTAAQFFPADKVAFTGNPIRKEVSEPLTVGAHEYLKLKPEIPTIFIVGGSLGAKTINDTIIDSLPTLVSKYQIIHQTGKNNFKEVSTTATVVLSGNPDAANYRPMPYLNALEMRMAAGVARLIISRAGSTIFEIAAWGKPSIIIPIPIEVSHDQTSNAFAYARSGGAEVIEENNLGTHILVSEINRIVGDPVVWQRMADGAKSFAKNDASEKIAQEIIAIALQHED